LALASAISEQGVDGVLRDKTRKPGRAPVAAKVLRIASLYEAPGKDRVLPVPPNFRGLLSAK
jgi:hypothetical protein